MTQMNSIVYKTHLSRLLCPKPLSINYVQGISNFPGKLERARPGILAIAYSPCGSPRRSYSLFCHPQLCEKLVPGTDTKCSVTSTLFEGVSLTTVILTPGARGR